MQTYVRHNKSGRGAKVREGRKGSGIAQRFGRGHKSSGRAQRFGNCTKVREGAQKFGKGTKVREGCKGSGRARLQSCRYAFGMASALAAGVRSRFYDSEIRVPLQRAHIRQELAVR